MDHSNAKKWHLGKTIQCAKCPWKVATDPRTIPDGYSAKKHRKLKKTISDGSINSLKDPVLRIMACHESEDQPVHCIGWLHHQLGRGNNIALRLDMLNCTNGQDITIIGEQHQSFEDTLPREK